MGIVQRQGIKQSVVTFVGIAIGALNILFIYPSAFSGEELGFWQVLLAAAKLILPFVMLGSMYLVVRFFKDFEDEQQGHQGYLPFILLWPLIGFLLFGVAYYFFQKEIFGLFEADEQFVSEYGIYLLPIVFFMAIGMSFTKYISNFKRITVPAIFNDLFIKIGVPLLAIALWVEWIAFEGVLIGITLLYLIILIALILYTSHLGQLHLKVPIKRLEKENVKSYLSYAGYGILGGLGTTIVPFIDTLMLGAEAGLVSSAIYMIPNFIGSAIDAPRKALSNITSPLLAESWKKKDLNHIQELYQKTSINQLIVGLLLFLCAWTSIDQIYALIPAGKDIDFTLGKYAVLILGLSKVLDMVTGVNSEIIGYSKYYRFNFYAILILTGVAIITNYYLIPIHDINGAAMATFISFAIFNLSKFLYLWLKLDLQPFSWATLKVIALGGVAYLAAAFLPNTGWIIPTIALKTIVITVVFGGGVLWFEVSEDISLMVNNIRKKLPF